MRPITHHRFGSFQARLTKEHRWGSALLSRNHSLEEEFERAKAAVEVTLKTKFSNSESDIQNPQTIERCTQNGTAGRRENMTIDVRRAVWMFRGQCGQ